MLELEKASMNLQSNKRIQEQMVVYMLSMQRAMSERNKANRAKQITKHSCGSKSFAEVEESTRDPTTRIKETPDRVWELQHCKKNDKGELVWSCPQAQQVHTQLEEIVQQQQSEENENPMSADEILVAILGKRTGYVRGKGYGMRPAKKNRVQPVDLESIRQEMQAEMDKKIQEEREEADLRRALEDQKIAELQRKLEDDRVEFQMKLEEERARNNQQVEEDRAEFQRKLEEERAHNKVQLEKMVREQLTAYLLNTQLVPFLPHEIEAACKSHSIQFTFWPLTLAMFTCPCQFILPFQYGSPYALPVEHSLPDLCSHTTFKEQMVNILISGQNKQ